MPANKPKRPGYKAVLLGQSVEDPATNRAIDDSAAQIARLGNAQRARFQTVVDLIVGANVVNHGLGRAPKHALVTPTVADATFAYALTAATERQATISVVGIAQTGAGLELA